MSEQQRKDLLISQRNAIIGQVDLFDNFLNNYNKSEHSNQLMSRFTAFVPLQDRINQVSDELDVLDSSVENTNKRFIILDKFFQISGKAHPIVKDFVKDTPSMNSENSSHSSSVDEVNSDNSYDNSFILKTPLPFFDGKLENWLSFTSIIDQSKPISPIAKLQHLKNSLCEEALKKIPTITITVDAYAESWKILNNAYENKRNLISRHLSLLLNLPKMEKETAKSLETLFDDAMQHYRSLKLLDVELSSEILITILEEKLTKSTRMKWEEKLQRDVFPTLPDPTEFLYSTANSLSKREGEKIDNIETPPAKKRRFEHKNNHRVFVTAKRKCPVCPESHGLYHCDEFKKLKIFHRIKIVKDANLCQNCLNFHPNTECFRGNCQTCGKKHNTLLHIPAKTNHNLKSDNSNKA